MSDYVYGWKLHLEPTIADQLVIVAGVYVVNHQWSRPMSFASSVNYETVDAALTAAAEDTNAYSARGYRVTEAYRVAVDLFSVDPQTTILQWLSSGLEETREPLPLPG